MDSKEPLPVHVDAHVLVVVKPAGLPSVPGRPVDLHDCVWSRLRARWADALVVHRLDVATSGLMVFARGALAQRTLSRAFEARRVDKGYEAVVCGGWLHGDDGTIDLPLAPDWPNRPRQKVCAHSGKPSLTRWWRIVAGDRHPARTRLRLQPLTGRSHQLRVHLAAMGHPILGDTLYGPARDTADRLHLHATTLAFVHPVTSERLAFASPAPF
jgi:tRNA pseudouridine32 synthase/23S rRNA pseudouridine746 synthase